MGISPWKTPYKLWLEKTKQIEAEDISGHWQVQRGVENEPKARAQLELMLGRDFPPQLFIHPEYDFMRVSLDGINKETLIEIKCPGKKTFEEAVNGKVPDHYMAQIQYQLMCSGCTKAIYFCFQPESGKSALVNVEPDLELQKKIKKGVIDFWQSIQSMEPPEMTDKDYTVVTERTWLDASIEYKNIQGMIKSLEERLDILKTTFIEKGIPLMIGSLKVTPYMRQGSVDYKKIEALKGVDLEPYRKPPTRAWRISG
jgi:putative phage-type endonuclease